jgi:tellurite resistance protein
MGFWKVLGGVAAGIGAVACLPVMGAVGAVTLVGAVVGGTVGAIGGAIASATDEEEKASCERAGEQKATAKYEERVQKLVAALKEMEARMDDSETYFRFLVALVAVGMATANADGTIGEEELQELEEFTTGIGCSKLPAHVKGMITKLKNNPPSFNTAMNYVRKAGDVDLALFEMVIEVVAASDGRVDEKEKALLSAFREATAA